ncbi:hypothetical protein G7K_6477-t1 [Saitoella complicata NRRL Y-17804]|uniref:Uncharacterized protein n=1 Tax=Saitoella complicata (strain BCRC 22490 / CBS 7301 / JCM 7358 / NBRC 10748 / NRRL Y-17804) TaxID=698492 RepID=A0A0E9NRC1_SAICN|nr:hypothetical protein G7K_6477-t1 [Saitoella complicata NRRL Y-17804]
MMLGQIESYLPSLPQPADGPGEGPIQAPVVNAGSAQDMYVPQQYTGGREATPHSPSPVRPLHPLEGHEEGMMKEARKKKRKLPVYIPFPGLTFDKELDEAAKHRPGPEYGGGTGDVETRYNGYNRDSRLFQRKVDTDKKVHKFLHTMMGFAKGILDSNSVYFEEEEQKENFVEDFMAYIVQSKRDQRKAHKRSPYQDAPPF